MQSFDQSLMQWYKEEGHRYESALFYHQPERIRASRRGIEARPTGRSRSVTARDGRATTSGSDAVACSKGPDCQPRGDCPAGHSRVPRAGRETVAVYSEADRESLHVRFADDDVCIGPPPSRLSYLNIPRSLRPRRSPGPTRSIRATVSWRRSAEFAERVRRPTSRSSDRRRPDPADGRQGAGPEACQEPAFRWCRVRRAIDDRGEALSVARRHRVPGDHQGAAGGGGKGMRVAGRREFHSRSAGAQRGLAAFGIGAVYVEKFLASPRHVEIQIMGDQHGNVMHLCERDCSVQRRHQKLIEEAPSPALPATARAMGMPRSAGRGHRLRRGRDRRVPAGRGRQFYFMEMNTRIQVEHPVTEMVTSSTLVKEQIRVAAGEKLSFRRGGSAPGPRHRVPRQRRRPVTELPDHPGLITAFHPPGGPASASTRTSTPGTPCRPTMTR